MEETTNIVEYLKKMLQEMIRRQIHLKLITSGTMAKEVDESIEDTMRMFNGMWFLCPTQDKVKCERIKPKNES